MGWFHRLLARPLTAARAAAVRGFAALLVASVFVACEPKAPETPWPVGLWLVARTSALERVLSQLERLEGTPLASWVRDFNDRREERGWSRCEVVAGGGADLAELLAGLDCDAGPESPAKALAPLKVLARLAGERRDRDIAFVWSPRDGAPVFGSLSVDPNRGIELEAIIPDDFFSGARALLRPGLDEPGPGVLNADESLIRVRLRPEGGLAIADWVPRGSQADRLFRLKSALFAGFVLDGSWEAAVYLPESGHPMPRAALAVGFVRRHSAVAAMEGFLADLSTQWPVHRSALSIDEAPGACLLDLNVLPDLAPCYVATDTALVVGWNPASLRQALDGSGRGGIPSLSGIPNAGGAIVDFGNFPEADARLAEQGAVEFPTSPLTYPWQRAVARAHRVGDGVQLNLTLESGAGA